ncbi:hypothetical protein ACIQPQ_14080 [Streptomyces sp. NPDC091281]|uniref:hypothetical protein n=1 Tax=Streptomyces sp. NPDC091281 TaxID=3365985 RepID=UPI0038305C84
MSTQPGLPLEGIPAATTGPRAAALPARPTAVGEPKGAARKGVRTAVRPNPQPTGDGRQIVGWLHIVAPGRATPSTTSRCACGRDRSAVGHARVLALIASHTAHRDLCPLRNPQEGRAAA